MTFEFDDPRLFAPQCISLTPVETVHENPWFLVRNRGGYFTIEYRRPQVIVLPVVANHSFVMVRVKRPIIADIPLELPAGNLEENESALRAGAREMAEETGIEIKDLHRFKMLPPVAHSPNRNPQLFYVYQISLTQQEYDQRNSHDDEISSVECLHFDDVIKMIIHGEIYVSIPVAVISRFLLWENLRNIEAGNL